MADFDAPAYASVALPPGFAPSCVCHPDAYVNKALVGSADGRLALLNFVTGRLVHVFAGFGAPVRSLAASPALDVVAAGLGDGRVVVHNIRVDATVATFTHDAARGAVTAAAFRTGPGPAVLACGGASGAVTVWDLASKRLQTVLKEAHDAPARALPAGPQCCVGRRSMHGCEDTTSPSALGRAAEQTIDYNSLSLRKCCSCAASPPSASPPLR